MGPYWIPSNLEFRLAIVPRPRGGDWLESELRALRGGGVDVLVSLLTSEEAQELGLSDEAASCKAAGIQFLSFPIPDRQVPETYRELSLFVEALRQELRHGKNVGAHCRAGIGRSSLILASVLVAEGLSAQDSFQLTSKARGLQVPDTIHQVEWVEGFAGYLIRNSGS